jgi:hypothetical protein
MEKSKFWTWLSIAILIKESPINNNPKPKRK